MTSLIQPIKSQAGNGKEHIIMKDLGSMKLSEGREGGMSPESSKVEFITEA